MSSDLVTRIVDHIDPMPERAELEAAIAEELQSWWEAWTAPVG